MIRFAREYGEPAFLQCIAAKSESDEKTRDWHFCSSLLQKCKHRLQKYLLRFDLDWEKVRGFAGQ